MATWLEALTKDRENVVTRSISRQRPMVVLIGVPEDYAVEDQGDGLYRVYDPETIVHDLTAEQVEAQLASWGIDPNDGWA